MVDDASCLMKLGGRHQIRLGCLRYSSLRSSVPRSQATLIPPSGGLVEHPTSSHKCNRWGGRRLYKLRQAKVGGVLAPV